VCRTRYLFSAPWNPPAQSVTLSGTGANPTFSWSAPAGLMADGYRIQIFQNNPNIGAIIAANLTHPTYTVKGSAWRMQKPLGWPMSRSKQLRDVASSQAIHQQILLVQIIRSVPGSADVRRNPVADRPATGATRLSMRVAEVGRYRRQRQECVLIAPTQRVSVPRRRQLIGSNDCQDTWGAICRCQTRPRARAWP
jgi:hypothetical protein